MDILGMVNDFIKNNKSDEQLAEEFITLYKKGHSINKIAKQYDCSLEKVKTIINQYGLTKESKTPTSFSNSKKHESNNDKKLELKISINIVVDVLNDGVDIEEVAKQYNITGKRLKELILFDGYKYYSFMNYWSKMNQEELCDFLVQELNQGYSPYDLSVKYVKSSKERLSFAHQVDRFLTRYKYNYNSTKKIWTKETIPSVDINTILNELNNGQLLKDVAEKFNTSDTNIRKDLKIHGYRFDRIFNVWTQEKRSELVKKLDRDLTSGKVTKESLKRQGLNTNLLQVELRFGGFDENLVRHVQKNKIPNKQQTKTIEEVAPKKDTKIASVKPNTVSQPVEVPITQSEKNKTQSSPTKELNSKEVEILKEILQDWRQKKIEASGIDNNPTELNIYIDQEMFMKLTNASEMAGISKSLVIARALKEYLKI
jgi:uncharacterized protein (DUF433 family)